jgi:transcription elongation GreA/GreB family factor
MSTTAPVRPSEPRRRRTRTSTSSRREAVLVTAEGKEQLEARLRHLWDVAIPEIRPLLASWDRDERDVATFERLCEEAQWLDRVLGVAEVMQPATETVVAPGARVLIEMPDGEQTWVRPVHPIEASLDDERISAISPLSVAIMGHPAGAAVEVVGPMATWTCRIVAVEPYGSAPRRRRRRAAA